MFDRGPINTGENFERAAAAGLVDKVKFAATTAMKRLGKTEEVANVIVFLLSDDASYITGGRFPLLAFLNGFSV